jgi:signal transduction histidine kinase
MVIVPTFRPSPQAVVRVAAAVVMLIGAIALVGWAFDFSILSRIIPAQATTKATTALALVLTAAALLGLAGPTFHRREVAAATAAVLIIVLVSLLEYVSSFSLGLDAGYVRNRAVPRVAHADRMALASAVSLLCASVAVLLIVVAPKHRGASRVRRGLAIAVLGIGALAVIGYVTQIGVLHTWHPFSAIAPLTSIALVLLGCGLLALEPIHGPETPALSEEQRIGRAAALALILAAGVTGIAGIAALELQARRSSEGELRSLLNTLVAEITTSLDLRTSRAAIITTRPNLRRHLRILSSDPGNTQSRDVVRDVLASFQGHEFTRLVARWPNGEDIARVGDEGRAEMVGFDVEMGNGRTIRLMWRDGVSLRHELALADADGPLGTIIAEQQVPRITELLLSNQTRFSSAEFLLCEQAAGHAARCFPSRRSPSPILVPAGEPGQARLVERALSEAPGVDTGIDYRGYRVFGAYTPLPAVGLAAVLKVEVDELYGPIRAQLGLALIVVAAVTAAGVVLVRARVGPLAARLEERVQERTAQLAHVNARLSILREIDRGLLAAEAPEGIAENTLRPLRNLLGVPRVIVFLADFEAGQVEWLAATGRHRLHIGPGVRYPVSYMGDVSALRRGVPQMLDVEALPPGPNADALLRSGVRFYVVVPMTIRGELIGGLSFGGPSPTFSAEQISIAEEVARQMAIVIEHSRLLGRVRRHATELEERVRERTAALEAAQAELVRNERLTTLGQLAGSVAHDLRHPLGVIKNAVYFLRLTLSSSEDARVRKHLAILDREIEISNRVITELLDFARAPSPTRTPTDLNGVIRGCIERAGALGASVELELRLAPDLPPIDADPLQLGQILDNLVRNAVQAMPSGGRLTVETVRDEDGGVTVSVSDTGVGMTPEVQAHIFEPLFTTKSKGVGLGLAIVKRLAEANGATIDVESAPAQGSRFRLRFR